jgi:tRNA A37 threonylcarbamoyladenosine dehydratase
MPVNNSRHIGIFSPHEFKHKVIHIIGLGNIGSHVATALARMGFENFILYDFDHVEDVNIATQNYLEHHEGQTKIEAIASTMNEINSDIKIGLSEEEIKEDFTIFNKDVGEPLCVISGVDSIEVRQTLKKLLETSTQLNNTPVIDGRLGKEQVEVLFAKTPNEWDVIISEEELANVGCTQKYISYTPLMSAALISATVKKMCLKETIPQQVIFEFKSNHYLKIDENN